MWAFKKFPSRLECSKEIAGEETIVQVEVFGYHQQGVNIPQSHDIRQPSKTVEGVVLIAFRMIFLVAFRMIFDDDIRFLPDYEFEERFKDYRLVD